MKFFLFASRGVITAYSLFFAYDELAFSTEIYGCSFSIFMIIDIAFICNVNFEENMLTASDS